MTSQQINFSQVQPEENEHRLHIQRLLHEHQESPLLGLFHAGDYFVEPAWLWESWGTKYWNRKGAESSLVIISTRPCGWPSNLHVVGCAFRENRTLPDSEGQPGIPEYKSQSIRLFFSKKPIFVQKAKRRSKTFSSPRLSNSTPAPALTTNLSGFSTMSSSSQPRTTSGNCTAN